MARRRLSFDWHGSGGWDYVADGELRRQLECGHCDWSTIVDRLQMEDRLRAQGMLRRNARASDEELSELLDAVASRMVCPECDWAGLIAGPCREDLEDWGAATACAGCGKPIPRERRESVPGAAFCAKCQEELERSGEVPSAEVDYCPRCGAPMTLARAGGAGTARYALRCSTWPHCRGEIKGQTRGR